VALSGDQVGVLLADHLIRHTDGDNRLVSSSIVSSRLIGHIAETAGVASVVTLTGFKWVARPIVDQPNRTFVLGYEEALGYCVGDRVRDKDGISAALVAAEMVADAIARGETLWDRLDRLAIRHGLHLTGPVSVRLPGADGLDRRTAIMDGLIDAPPDHLGGGRLVESIDLSTGEVLPPTAGLVLHYDDGTRVIIRPSGTEPKLKAYVEVVEPVGDPASLRAATDRGESRLGRYRSGVANLLGG
jgi:phosphomannomutase